MSGVVLSGMYQTAVVWLPGQEPVPIDNSVSPTIEEWMSILAQTDDPQIFELDETGATKAIHRRSMRAVGGAMQWRIWRRDGFQCLYCGVDADENNPLTVDHFMPVEHGGGDAPENLISACKACNKRKGSMSPDSFCTREGHDYFALKEYLAGNAPKIFISHLNR